MVFSKNSAYLKATKYLNYLLRSVCIITRIPSDENQFVAASNHKQADRYFILEWMYTAVLYVFSCFVFYHLIYTENILKPYLDDLTLDNINYVLMTSLSVLIVLLNPLMASRARENREEYFKLWQEYQIQYEQYTVSELNLGSSILIVLLIFGGAMVTTLELVANCVLTSQVQPTYVYANWIIYFYTNLTTIQWVTDCHLLTIASEMLLDQLLCENWIAYSLNYSLSGSFPRKTIFAMFYVCNTETTHALQTIRCPNQYSMSNVQMTTVATSNRVDAGGKGYEARVSCFVELWRKLSDMSSGLMDTGRGVYEFNFAVQSVIVVQALYGIVALYIGRHHSIVHYYVYFPTAAWSILNLVVLCEAAYSVTNQIGFKTNIAIQSMACNKFSLETQEQIFTALKTIQSHTPVITVSGYFTMDRTYILSYLGVAVSYIIVLAQFKIGTS